MTFLDVLVVISVFFKWSYINLFQKRLWERKYIYFYFKMKYLVHFWNIQAICSTCISEILLIFQVSIIQYQLFIAPPPQTPPPPSPFPLVSPPLFSESKKYSFCRMKRSFWDYIFAIKGSVKNVSEISKASAYNFR